MVPRNYVPSPLTILTFWFSQKRQGQLFSQSPHQAFQTVQMHKGKVDIRVPLAFTLPGGEAQEDMASREPAPEPQNPGGGVGAGKLCPLAHSLGPGFGPSFLTFQDSPNPTGLFLTTLGGTYLGL